MIYGKDKFQYQVVEGWGRGHKGYEPGGMITGVAVDAQDRLYAFRRTPESAVLIYDRGGRFLASWGTGIFTEPHAIWVSEDNYVYCTDRKDHTVRKFTAEGQLLMTLGIPGQPGASGMPFNGPAKAVTTPSDGIFVADGYFQCRIHQFSLDGELLHSWGEPGPGPCQFNLPHGIDMDALNRVIVVDRENHRLQLFDVNGNLLNIWAGLKQPMDLCIDIDNTIYIAEAYQRISIYKPDGEIVAQWGEKGNTPGQFASFLHGICVDSHGDMYVADEARMQKFARV